MVKHAKELALVGCGYWGKNLARNFHKLGALHTICEPNPELAELYRSKYPDVIFVSDLRHVIESPKIKQVVIATPAATHYSIAKQVLIAGKDVFVEKPICLDLSEAEKLKEISEREKRILMVGHLLQYHSVVIELQKMIAEGLFGKIQSVTSRRLNLGKIRKEEDVLWSFAPHDISVVLSFFSGAKIEDIRCDRQFHLSKEVADVATLDIKFSNNQHANIQVSWLNPFKEQRLTIVGEKAMAVFDDTQSWAEKLYVRFDYLNNREIEYIELPENEPLADECSHFLNACLDRVRPKTDAEEGIAVLKVLSQIL